MPRSLSTPHATTSAALAAEDATDLVGIDGEVNVTTPITIECCKGQFRTLV